MSIIIKIKETYWIVLSLSVGSTSTTSGRSVSTLLSSVVYAVEGSEKEVLKIEL